MDEVKPVACVPTVEHREPCESRGSRTVLGAPGGEIPPGDSTKMRKPRNEHMSAGVPRITDIARRGWDGRRVPGGDVSVRLAQQAGIKHPSTYVNSRCNMPESCQSKVRNS